MTNVTCGLTVKKLGSALCPKLVIELWDTLGSIDVAALHDMRVLNGQPFPNTHASHANGRYLYW